MQAILIAADSVGNPSKRGQGGICGYMQYLAIIEPRVFGRLLSEVLRLQGPGDHDETINVQNAREILIDRISAIAHRIQLASEKENDSGSAPADG